MGFGNIGPRGQRGRSNEFPQRRFRYGLLLGAAFFVGVASGPTVGFLARASTGSVPGEASQFLKVFGDVFERVRAEYVDPVSDKEILENAINGMLTASIRTART